MTWFDVSILASRIRYWFEPKHYKQLKGSKGQFSITFSSTTPGKGIRFVEDILRELGFEYRCSGVGNEVLVMECEAYKAFIVEERMWWHKPVGKRLRTVRVDVIHRKYL